jgi:hypothetical protein
MAATFDTFSTLGRNDIQHFLRVPLGPNIGGCSNDTASNIPNNLQQATKVVVVLGEIFLQRRQWCMRHADLLSSLCFILGHYLFNRL